MRSRHLERLFRCHLSILQKYNRGRERADVTHLPFFENLRAGVLSGIGEAAKMRSEQREREAVEEKLRR